MMASTRRSVRAAGCALVAVACTSLAAGQSPARRPVRPITPHAYPLDDAHYLRWPLPASEQAYGRIDGARLKEWVGEIVAVSRKSRDEGNLEWGRVAGLKSDQDIEQWVEDKFKRFGLQDIHRQYFDLPPQWIPTAWSLTATGGGKTLSFPSARAAGGSQPTPAGGLELEAVWVGLGTDADFLGRDVKGKLVVIQSMPTPSAISHSAVWNGALARVAEKGAAAAIVSITSFGNLQTHMNGSAAVPTFSIGTDDLTSLRVLLEAGTPVKVKMTLAVDRRSGLRDASVWGTLPGATDEDIVIMAHHDAYFDGAVDNGSGMAVMMGLAEYFAKIPQAQRRRTLKFVSTAGHHAGSAGTMWMHDNKDTFLAKTALLLNCEHVSVTQTYYFGNRLRKSTQSDARRWWVFGSDMLAAITLKAYQTFGVAVYADMEPNASGDMGNVSTDAPSVQMIESPVFYHTDGDQLDVVPAAGLEGVGRAYAKLVDEVNRLERKDLIGPPTMPAPK